MISKFQPICIGLATCLFALSYAMSQYRAVSLLITFLGVFWMIGYSKGWKWPASVIFTLLLGASAIGIWLNLSRWCILLGVIGALCAWDLDHFAQRIRYAGRVMEKRKLERHHIRRLLVVSIIGLLCGTLALKIKIELNFSAVFLFGLIAVLGLRSVIIYLKKA